MSLQEIAQKTHDLYTESLQEFAQVFNKEIEWLQSIIGPFDRGVTVDASPRCVFLF